MRRVPINTWITNGDVDAYGYDIYGNEISGEKDFGSGAYVNGPKEPQLTSFYLQDRMKYQNLIINAGLRLDYFDMDDQKFKDPNKVRRDSSSRLVLQSSFKDIEPKVLVSPRLGILWPINDKTEIYAQYGTYIQMPQLSNSESPFGTSAQSVQELSSPPHTPHSSSTLP